MTLTTDAVVLNSTSPGSPVPEEGGLLIPGTAARVHENTVPAVLLVGVYEKRELLQISGGVSELVSKGVGLTTTTTL